MHLTLLNTAEDQQRLLPALEQFARQCELPAKVLQAVDLALEEHVSNLIDHAYGPTGEPGQHQIHLRFSIEPNWLWIEVEDDGAAFDPTTQPAVNTSLPPDEKPIGGLGVHLIRSVMDSLEYRSEGRRNILRLGKRLSRNDSVGQQPLV